MRSTSTAPPSRVPVWRWTAGAAVLTFALLALIVPGKLPLGEQAQARLRKTFDLPPDLELMARTHAGFISVRVADLFSEDLVRKLPEGMRQELLGQLGVTIQSIALKPAEIERASVQILPGGLLVFVQTAKGYDRAKILKGLKFTAKETKIKGKTVHVDARQNATFYPVDDRVFVVGSSGAMKQLLENDGSKAPDKLHLEAVNQAAGKHHVVVAMVRGDVVVRSMWYLYRAPALGYETPRTLPAEKVAPPKDKGPELKDRPVRDKDKDRPAREKEGECTARVRAADKPGADDPPLDNADIGNAPTLDDLFAAEDGILLPFKPLCTAKYSWWTLDLGAETKVDTRATYADEEDAKDGETAIKTLLYVLRESLQIALVGELGPDLKKAPKLSVVIKSIQAAFRNASVKRDGSVLRGEVRLKVEPKAIAAASEEVQKLGARARAMNDLKQLALAMHVYHDNFGRLPGPAIYDAGGKPLLSWRVAILPFIEGGDLYREFKLDEPWDSAHNKKLIEKMPAVFAPKEGTTKGPYMTYYQVFVGPDAIFDPARTAKGPTSLGRRIVEITDGTSNTLMIAEAADPVPWTKPDDIPFDASKAPPKLGGVFPDGFHAAFADGSVAFIRKSIDPKVLTALITPQGGEAVDWSKWDMTGRRRRLGRGFDTGSSSGKASTTDRIAPAEVPGPVDPTVPPKDSVKPKDKP